MNKKKLVWIAPVLAALVCAMMFVGCNAELAGSIEVYNRSEGITYWAKISEDDSEALSIEPRHDRSFSITEEGYYIVYYCERYDDETQGDLGNRTWLYITYPVHAIVGETVEVAIPNEVVIP